MVELMSRQTVNPVTVGDRLLKSGYEVLVIDPIRRTAWVHTVATGFRDWLKADDLDCFWGERIADPPVVIREPWESDERYQSRCEAATLLVAATVAGCGSG